ncbi:expressed unknown protein [Seminavis robusta]|uniref:Uncharacterized protein n=1 Tax=Seminavis robusta TaxID=568900 RepID=A0A9N8EKQ2_9STRA|nr:expressed unknown protein [Seminavis robusta]|eukprot:Sro1309_g261550.1 n/a (243) ;mRNA; r:27414-28142
MFSPKSEGTTTPSMFKPFKRLLCRKKTKSFGSDATASESEAYLPTSTSEHCRTSPKAKSWKIGAARTSESNTCLLTSTSEHCRTSTKTQSWKIDVARAFIENWNEHDMNGAEELITKDFVSVFSGADNAPVEMEYDDMVAEFTNLFEAFPDFKFQYDSIKECLANDVVVLSNLVSSGHHTAKPYAFGPCPPIEPSGKYVRNSPETYYFHFRDATICKLVVEAEGEMTGPPGIYTQLGGFPLM